MTPPRDPRTTALRRFAMSITAFTILGHTVLGFEQAYATPLIAILVAYVLDIALESLDAWAQGRPPKYRGGRVAFLDFLLPAHISGLACAMLLYASSRLAPTLLAVTVAIVSKYLIRIRVKGRLRHTMNPSNLGIAAVLILFPWVGIAPPYQFTEWFGGPLDWVIPLAILASGTMLNAQLTKKIPLILGWVGGFLAQALIRTLLDGTATASALLAVTGVAFVLFTNYMITDPGTTPVKPARQVAFGVATAAVYGVLVQLHVVYGLFFALVAVCAVRTVALAIVAARTPAPGKPTQEPAPPEPERVRLRRPAAPVGTALTRAEEAG